MNEYIFATVAVYSTILSTILFVVAAERTMSHLTFCSSGEDYQQGYKMALAWIRFFIVLPLTLTLLVVVC
jgi:hypothetical protein